MNVRLSPVKKAETGGNCFFDFWKDYFSVLEIEAESAKQQEITLAVGEVLGKDGKINREPGGWRIYQEQTVTLHPGFNRIAMNMTHRIYAQVNYGMPVPAEFAPFRYAEVRGFSVRRSGADSPVRADPRRSASMRCVRFRTSGSIR